MTRSMILSALEVLFLTGTFWRRGLGVLHCRDSTQSQIIGASVSLGLSICLAFTDFIQSLSNLARSDGVILGIIVELNRYAVVDAIGQAI